MFGVRRSRHIRSTASTALAGLTNPAIAFPLDVGHLPRRNISFERTEAADGSFPSLQGNFVVARRQRHPKSALIIRDERGHLAIILFHHKRGIRQRDRARRISSDWPRISWTDRNYPFNSRFSSRRSLPSGSANSHSDDPESDQQLAKSHCALYSRRLLMANDSEAQSEPQQAALDEAVVASKILRFSRA
jgi:hypothetical protein